MGRRDVLYLVRGGTRTLAVTGQFGLDATQISSWIFIVWLTGAIASIALSVAYRQPLAITTSLPALVLLGSVAGQFNFEELVGANLLAGLLTVALGLLGFGRRLLMSLPMPLVRGMLGGSLLGHVVRPWSLRRAQVAQRDRQTAEALRSA